MHKNQGFNPEVIKPEPCFEVALMETDLLWATQPVNKCEPPPPFFLLLIKSNFKKYLNTVTDTEAQWAWWPVNVTQCNHILLSKGNSSLQVSPPRLSTAPPQSLLHASNFALLSHCSDLHRCLPSTLNVLLLLTFPAPLYHPPSPWAQSDSSKQQVINQDSTFLSTQHPPPSRTPQQAATTRAHAYTPSLRDTLTDAQTLAISSFNAACFSIFIPSWLFLCWLPLKASFQECFLPWKISVMVEDSSLHSVIKNDDTEESGPPPLTLEFDSSS